MIRFLVIVLASVSINLTVQAQEFTEGSANSTLRDSDYRCSGECKRVYIKSGRNDTVYVKASGYPKARCVGSLKETCADYCQSYLFEGCHLENVSVY